MIRVNGKEINFENAFYAYAFNDSLNPTGLGSIGIYFEYEDLNIYIGIKNDVIDIITNKNTNCFLNLEDKEIELSESLDGDAQFGDGVVRDVYINQAKISIDTALFRKYIYKDQIANYANNYIDYVAKDSGQAGALLRLEIPFVLGVDAVFIGYIYTKDKELLVLNKAIVDKDTLKNEVRYNIWKVKQNLTQNSLGRTRGSIIFEDTITEQKDGYADYYNKQYKSYMYSLSKTSDVFLSFSKEMGLSGANVMSDKKKDNGLFNVGVLYMDEKRAKDSEYDVFEAFNTIIAPGIVNGTNMANFGVKEARRGYWDLSKDRAFNNVGYRDKGIIFGDNFYVNTTYTKRLDNESRYRAPIGYFVYFDVFLTKVLNTKDITESLEKEIYYSKQEMRDALYKIIEDYLGKDKFKNIKKYLDKFIKIQLGIAYLSMIDDREIKPGKTVIYTHPYYPRQFAVHVDESNIECFDGLLFTSPVSSHKFGFKDNKYYYKSIAKEFRPTIKRTLNNIDYYYDLIRYNNKNTLMKSKIETFYDGVGIGASLFHDSANVYILETEKLIECMGTDRGIDYPFGYKNCYIRI